MRFGDKTLSKDGYKFVYAFGIVDRWDNIEVVDDKLANEILNRLKNYNLSNSFRTIDEIDSDKKDLFECIIDVEVDKFYFLDWPIFFRRTHDDGEVSENLEKWREEWKQIFDITFTNDVALMSKTIKFECRLIDNSVYPFALCYHRISILRGKNCFYVMIDLAGRKEHYKCRDLDDLIKCLVTEIK